MKSAWYGLEQMTRTLIRYFGSHPGESIETIKVLATVKVIASALADYRKCVRIERNIDLPPPDIVLRRGLLDDAFVFGRTPGLDAGVGDKRTVLGDMGIFLVENSMLVKGAGREVGWIFSTAISCCCRLNELI